MRHGTVIIEDVEYPFDHLAIEHAVELDFDSYYDNPVWVFEREAIKGDLSEMCEVRHDQNDAISTAIKNGYKEALE